MQIHAIRLGLWVSSGNYFKCIIVGCLLLTDLRFCFTVLQDVYHRYPSQQYLQGYGGPSATVNSPYPYGQFGLPPHLPTHSHQTFPPYATPSHNMVPYGGIPRMASPYSPHSIPRYQP